MIDESIKKWIVKAMEDFKIVSHELTFPENEISTGPVCFHCQQVVEKLLKAFLVLRNTDFGKTHDSVFLLELCAQHAPDFRKLNVGNLRFYAVDVRYPDEFYIPAVEEARECFSIAKNVKEFIFGKLGITDKDLEE